MTAASSLGACPATRSDSGHFDRLCGTSGPCAASSPRSIAAHEPCRSRSGRSTGPYILRPCAPPLSAVGGIEVFNRPPVACGAHTPPGALGRLGMEARASIIPQSGQMSVALSARERAGRSVYLLPQIGHTRPACSLLLTAAASFRLLWSAVRPQGAEAQLLAVDVRRPDDLGKGRVARHA